MQSADLVFNPVPDGDDLPESMSPLRWGVYRVSFYLALTLIEDPAWLAFWFC